VSTARPHRREMSNRELANYVHGWLQIFSDEFKALKAQQNVSSAASCACSQPRVRSTPNSLSSWRRSTRARFFQAGADAAGSGTPGAPTCGRGSNPENP
jgi:hypothetical protein